MDTAAEKTLDPKSPETHPIRDQAGRVASEVRELGHVAASSTGEAIDHARDKGREMLAEAKRESRQAREHVEDYVREHPLGAIACAAGLGGLLVVLLKR